MQNVAVFVYNTLGHMHIVKFNLGRIKTLLRKFYNCINKQFQLHNMFYQIFWKLSA
jgi:hypothetical protein